MSPARLASLLLAGTILWSSTASATTPETAEHLIVTPATLVSEFQVLAAHRTMADVPSAVVSLETVLATAPAGRDDAETLRNYLIQIAGHGNLRYVLLGGDSGQVPVRFVRSTFYPPGSSSDLACDLYYAGLSGNWDADGDDVFGEPFLSGADPGDDADLDPDLAVGRAPVSTAAEAQRFVQGVLGYDNSTSTHYGSALLLAEVLFPSDWMGGGIQLDGAAFGDEVRDFLLTHPTPASSMRLYENHAGNPGSSPLTVAAATAALNSGSYGFVFVTDHGQLDHFSLGDATLSSGGVDALANAPNYNFLLALTSAGADFVSGSVLESAVLAPAGGSAGVLGFSDAVFPNTASGYTAGYVEELVAQSAVFVGDAWASVLTDRSPNTFFNTSSRWTSLTLTLLADPAMPFRSEENPVPVEKISFSQFKRTFGGN